MNGERQAEDFVRVAAPAPSVRTDRSGRSTRAPRVGREAGPRRCKSADQNANQGLLTWSSFATPRTTNTSANSDRWHRQESRRSCDREWPIGSIKDGVAGIVLIGSPGVITGPSRRSAVHCRLGRPGKDCWRWSRHRGRGGRIRPAADLVFSRHEEQIP